MRYARAVHRSAGAVVEARSLSNGESARELVVGDAAVKTHVARIFAKLDLHDRAQAVVLVYESGLVPARHPVVGGQASHRREARAAPTAGRSRLRLAPTTQPDR